MPPVPVAQAVKSSVIRKLRGMTSPLSWGTLGAQQTNVNSCHQELWANKCKQLPPRNSLYSLLENEAALSRDAQGSVIPALSLYNSG